MFACATAWPRYRVIRVQELGQYNLEILSADLSDDALYECQAPDAALRSRRAKLTVLSASPLLASSGDDVPHVVCVSNDFLSVSVPPDDPVIDGGPEVLLNAGESYNLTCVSRGAKPPSMVEWMKDGLPIEGAVSTTVSFTTVFKSSFTSALFSPLWLICSLFPWKVWFVWGRCEYAIKPMCTLVHLKT